MPDDVRLRRSRVLRTLAWMPVPVMLGLAVGIAIVDAVSLGGRAYDEIVTWSAALAVLASPLSLLVSTGFAVAASVVSRSQGPTAASALWAAPVAVAVLWMAQCGLALLFTALHISQMNFALA